VIEIVVEFINKRLRAEVPALDFHTRRICQKFKGQKIAITGA